MSTLRTNEIKMLDDRGSGNFTFDSVADLQASTQLAVGQKVRTLGYHSPGDGGGCDYEIVSSGTASNFGFLYESLTGSGFEAKLLGGGIIEDKNVLVPSDYASIQEAIDDLYKIRPSDNSNIIITIESGEVIDSQTIVRDGDYGHFLIRSVDSEVSVSREAMTIGVSTGNTIGTRYPLFAVSDGTLPTIDALFNMDSTGTSTSRDGVLVQRGRGLVMPGGGVKNAGSMGIVALSASNVVFDEAIFTGSGLDNRRSRGAYCFSSVMSGRGADVSNALFRGFECRAGFMDIQAGIANDVSGSTESARGKALYAPEGAVVNASDLVALNAEENAIMAINGSTVNARGADVTGAGRFGFFASNGSTISAEYATGTFGLWPNHITNRGIIYSASSSPMSVLKSSTQSVNNTTTLVDCTDINFNTIPEKKVYFEIDIRHQSVTGANLKIGFRSSSGSADIRWWPENSIYQDVSQSVSFTRNLTGSETLSVYSEGEPTVRNLKISGIVAAQSSPDEVFLQFSQDTATTGETSIAAFTSLILNPSTHL